ncbi:N-acetyllactosaminide 3-alpha-galactosyltransferase [Paragonimus heterotremus]|uniref:Beta-1,4-galactosyltransferase n=1 Tax=Paragonimus heterotremus TaxID=100268 RepID=A0A8J4WIC1_9TREM|nr:N-acetyllactosaminide 3-alpha-galactosyltransferase [Paragonimus heterotremus]
MSWLQSPRRVRQAIFPVTLFTTVALLILRTKNIPRPNAIFNVETSLKLDLNQILSQELLQLLKQDVPPVEDVGESIMDDWFKKEAKFCGSINSNKSSPFSRPECLVACVNRGSLLSVPQSQRRNLIVIPYRDRQTHLEQVLPRIQQLLTRQNICYLIVIAEQFGAAPFNKGKIMNTAFVQSLNWFPFHCVTFHDVDLIPLSDEVPYSCSQFPRHTSVQLDKFNNRLPYVKLIGGILTIPVKIFLRVNGFSNLYWGWGAEDDDMYERLMANKIPITRSDPKVSKFRMLPHNPSPATSADFRSRILASSKARHRLDGLNSLNFSIIKSSFVNRLRNKTLVMWPETDGYNKAMTRVHHIQIDLGDAPSWLKSNAYTTDYHTTV